METTYEKLTDEQVSHYLERLGISCGEGGMPQPSLEFLNRLVEAHQKRIPFEAIDVYQQKLPISLEVQKLYEKIVEKKRGGYCFEMNGLFISLLRTLGYDAWSCYCRVIRGRAELRPVSHRGNIVCIENQLYFCDVGFGGPMPSQAILLESGRHQKIGQEEYWPVEEEHGWWGLMRMRKGSQDDFDSQSGSGEQLELMFQISMADPLDFIPLNAHVSERPEAVFRLKFMANVRTDRGYKDISDMVFTIKEDGVVTRRELDNEQQREEVLKEHFGICLE